MTKFLIIDGNSIACRAEFAHNTKFGNDLTNSKGIVTGGTYRFISMFDRLLNQIKPTHIIVVWDVSRNTWRRQLYPEYKMNREVENNTNKDNLYISFKNIKEILKAINVINFEFDGYEGDDLLGTFANISTADKNFIVSGDKDTFQLIDKYTNVIFPKNGFKEIEIVDEKYLINKYDIKNAKQFIELKALMGDAGDNIPGISGCGEKTASKLLKHFGSINNIIKNDDFNNIKGINKTIVQNIKQWQPMANTILKLVTIDVHVPVEIEFEDCELNINWHNAINIFKELEFNSLINKIDKLYHKENEYD
jgi:DNA polymerase-1